MQHYIDEWQLEYDWAKGLRKKEMAVFYSSSNLLGRDILVLAVSALVAVALGALAMRRGIAS